MQMKMQMKMSQQLIMTPQLQQAIKLLQLSRAELEELIEQTLIENPVLEEGIDMDSFPGKKEDSQDTTETSENPEVVDDTENYETAREEEQENNMPASELLLPNSKQLNFAIIFWLSFFIIAVLIMWSIYEFI